MKRLLLILFLGLTLCTEITAQIQTEQSYATSGDSRYEIIQSGLSRKMTFKIDKYDGIVYQLVKTETDGLAWQKIERMLVSLDNLKPNEVNFQLFLGGIAIRDCILLNIHIGATWVLVKDENDNTFFEPFY